MAYHDTSPSTTDRLRILSAEHASWRCCGSPPYQTQMDSQCAAMALGKPGLARSCEVAFAQNATAAAQAIMAGAFKPPRMRQASEARTPRSLCQSQGGGGGGRASSYHQFRGGRLRNECSVHGGRCARYRRIRGRRLGNSASSRRSAVRLQCGPIVGAQRAATEAATASSKQRQCNLSFPHGLIAVDKRPDSRRASSRRPATTGNRRMTARRSDLCTVAATGSQRALQQCVNICIKARSVSRYATQLVKRKLSRE